MENFGLFELISKILSQKQPLEPKKNDNIYKQKQGNVPTVTPLPAYYTQSSIISLIKQHEKLSKQIDLDNKKK